MEEFFSKFLEAIFEVFTNLFSFFPLQVFFIVGFLVVFNIFFFQFPSSRGK